MYKKRILTTNDAMAKKDTHKTWTHNHDKNERVEMKREPPKEGGGGSKNKQPKCWYCGNLNHIFEADYGKKTNYVTNICQLTRYMSNSNHYN